MGCNVLLPNLNLTTVWVVSWVYWNGDEQGGGGFNWFWSEDLAKKAFKVEAMVWKGGVARIRLVEVQVPDVPDQEAGDEAAQQRVTDLIDENLDRIENHHDLPSVRVHLELGR